MGSIISESVEKEALDMLVVNAHRGTLECCAVKAPGEDIQKKRELLQETAIFTNGKAITKDSDIRLQDVELSDLGRAIKVRVDEKSTTIIGGAGRIPEKHRN